jgi:hypothetical protein
MPDQGLVVLHAARDDCVALDEIGQRIWGLLDQPGRITDSCSRLNDKSAVNSEQIAVNVTAFLDELGAEGPVRVVDAQPA